MPTVTELKAELKRLGQSTAGNKAELERRLALAKQSSADGGGSSQQQQRITVPAAAPATKVREFPSAKRFQEDVTIEKNRGACEQFFKEISKGQDAMDAERTLEFCELLGVDPEQVTALALSFYLNSPNMGTFSQTGFVDGLLKNFKGASSVVDVKAQLPAMERRIQTDLNEIYKFSFTWGCEPGIRNLKKEVAMSLWKLLISKASFIHIDEWMKHWEASSARVVTKDEWLSFKRFVDSMKKSQGLAESDDAWPVVIDEFIERLKKGGSVKA